MNAQELRQKMLTKTVTRVARTPVYDDEQRLQSVAETTSTITVELQYAADQIGEVPLNSHFITTGDAELYTNPSDNVKLEDHIIYGNERFVIDQQFDVILDHTGAPLVHVFHLKKITDDNVAL